MFDFIGSRMQKAIAKANKKTQLKEEDILEITRDIRLALLEADVNLIVVKNFINSIEKKNDIRNKEVDKLEKEYTTSFNNLKPGPIPQDLKILQDHYVSYLSLINLEFEMYYDISNFLSDYSRKIEWILRKADL